MGRCGRFELIRAWQQNLSVLCAFDLLELDGFHTIETYNALTELLSIEHCRQCAFRRGRRNCVSRSLQGRVRGNRIDATCLALSLSEQFPATTGLIPTKCPSEVNP